MRGSMSDHAKGDAAHGETEGRGEPDRTGAVEATETYRTDEGTVFYDAENPLAWLESSRVINLETYT